MIYIFDLDGTLCDNRHRLHYIAGTHHKTNETKDYQAYHKACVDDEPLPLVHTLNAVLGTSKWMEFVPTRVKFFTGRSDIAYTETVEWLYRFCNAYQIDETVLKMCKDGDWRKEFILKNNWLVELLKDTPASQIIAFDDCRQCVDMYRRHGVTCCQVAEGDF